MTKVALVLGTVGLIFSLERVPVAEAPEPRFAGQMVCDSRAKVLGFLAAKFTEEPVAIGLTLRDTVLEVVASAQGTWTLIETARSRISCTVAAGKAWHMQLPRPDGPGA